MNRYKNRQIQEARESHRYIDKQVDRNRERESTRTQGRDAKGECSDDSHNRGYD